MTRKMMFVIIRWRRFFWPGSLSCFFFTVYFKHSTWDSTAAIHCYILVLGTALFRLGKQHFISKQVYVFSWRSLRALSSSQPCEQVKPLMCNCHLTQTWLCQTPHVPFSVQKTCVIIYFNVLYQRRRFQWVPSQTQRLIFWTYTGKKWSLQKAMRISRLVITKLSPD